MDTADIDFSGYEIEPAPTNVTPREYVLWATGKDVVELRNPITGVDFTWEELERMDAIPIVTRLIQMSTRPIRFRKKRKDTI